LSEAHAKGLVHRDIKPSNVMVANYGGQADHVKVLDFGLVKELGSGDAALTQADTIVGTPLYIAPEAITAPEKVDARSDVYALGTVAYFLLTASPVFEGRNVVEVSLQHLHGVPQEPSARLGRALPDKLERLVLRCLAKAPEDRPQDAIQLQVLLRDTGLEGSWTTELAAKWWAANEGRMLRVGEPSAGMGSRSAALTVDLEARHVPVALPPPAELAQPAAG
jgi:serine/threonine-protein kinase